jgi:hypothetical protein
MAGGLALFAIAALLFTSLTVRNVETTPSSYLIVGFGAAGLVVLGPLLRLITVGMSVEAWQHTAVALPVLLGGLAPFALRRRAVSQTMALLAWCGFVTALLFWTAAGVFSLSLG